VLLLHLSDNLRYAHYARNDELKEVMAANAKLRARMKEPAEAAE
jgi:hypothetical protein